MPTLALPGRGEGSREAAVVGGGGLGGRGHGSGHCGRTKTGRERPGCSGGCRNCKVGGGVRGEEGLQGQGCVELLALLRRRCLHTGGLGTSGQG